MKENAKLNIQSTAVTLSAKKSSRMTVFPQNERRITKISGETKEDSLTNQASTKEEQKQGDTSTRKPSSVRAFTNVAFPRGFTPSQCALLASRQRISNYLNFKANDTKENELPHENSLKPKATTNRTRTCGIKETRDLKPILRHESEVKGAKHQSDSLLPLRLGRASSINERTGLTGYFKWKSKEEIAKYLVAHAHARLLWIQEMEKINAEREAEFSDERTLEENRRFPQNPVYLFDKDSRSMRSNSRHAYIQ